MSIAQRFLVMTLVIAWRMVVPAFSISFRVRPLVTQTFSAGAGCQLSGFPGEELLERRVFSFVMRTPLANVWKMAISIEFKGGNTEVK